jgi:putative endopeptidase
MTELKSENGEVETVSYRDDFYQYVNKKWLEDSKNKIPEEYSKWGGFVRLHDVTLQQLIQLVSELRNKENKNEEEMKISTIWEASVKRFESWKENSATCDPISRELEILDAYFAPNFSVDEKDFINKLAEYFHYSQMNSVSNVFDLSAESDLTNTNNVILYFSTGNTSLPSREYYLDDKFKKERDLYKKHLENVRNIINTRTNIYLDDKFVQNVFEFEEELAKYTMSEGQARNYDQYFTNTTLKGLYQEINNLASLDEKQQNYDEQERNFTLSESQIKKVEMFFEEVYSLFDFRNIMKKNYEKNFILTNTQIPPLPEHVTAFDGDAIRRIFNMILNPENFQKYRSFLQYNIICALKAYCTQDLDEEFFDFYQRKLSGKEKQKSEDKRSIQIVDALADEMLGKVYVSKHFQDIYKADIKQMINEVISIMKSSIHNNDWLTDPTKERAIKKINRFTAKIGYPDIWKDYSMYDIKMGDSLYDISKKSKKWMIQTEFLDKINSVVDRDKWLMSPHEVNAYFLPTQNEIVFTSAILQPPFYCKEIPDIDFDITEEKEMIVSNENNIDDLNNNIIQAVNFGAIGAVISHEITHGYDDNGRKFDEDGNLNEWWSEEDLKKFNEKTKLMEEQINLYSFTDKETSLEYKLNSQLTMGENLADAGGLSLALQAMNKRMKEKNMSQNEMKCYQRIMFKSYANVWKNNVKKEYMINSLTTDPHSPADFRANLVKNIDEFYEVFNINENDKMYIAKNKRVRMW